MKSECYQQIEGIVNMKKAATVILCLAFALSLFACGTKTKNDATISEFSYAEERALYAQGESGVKTSGFVNVIETEVTVGNVTEIAGRECTKQYNSSEVSKDTATGVWRVVFFYEGMDGDCQTVYLDSNGITLLVVRGK